MNNSANLPNNTEPPQPNTPSTSRMDDSKPLILIGVGGWLTFFCVTLLLIGPVTRLINLATTVTAYSNAYPSYPTLRNLIFIIVPINISIVIFGFISGYSLATKKANSVHLTKRFLYYSFIASITITLLHFCIHLPSELLDRMMPDLMKGVVSTTVYSGIWYLYLSRSARVRNTYIYKPEHNEMGYRVGLITASLICIIFMQISTKQQITDSNPDSLLIKSPKMSRFISHEGNFSIVFPGVNVLPEKSQETIQTPSGSITTTSFMIANNNDAFLVEYWDNTNDIFKFKSIDTFLNDSINGAVHSLNGKIITSEDFKFTSKYPAKKVFFLGTTQGLPVHGNMAIILINNRVYVIQMMIPASEGPNEKMFADFLESFNIT